MQTRDRETVLYKSGEVAPEPRIFGVIRSTEIKYFNGRALLLTLACELRVSPFIGLIVVLYLAFWLWRLGHGRVAEAKSSRI